MLYIPVSGKVRRARSAAAGMQSGAGRSEGSDPCESPVDQEPDDTEDDLLNAFTLLFPGDEPPEGRGQEVEPSRSASGLTMQDEIIETGNTFHDVLSLVSPSMRDRIAPALASFAQERKSSVLLHARFSGGRSVSLLLSNCTIVTITLDADGISVIDCRICKGLAAAVEAECGAGEALCCAGFLASGFCVLCSRSAKMMLIKPRNPAENLNEWRPSALRAAVAPLQQPAMQITVNADQADPPPPPPPPPTSPSNQARRRPKPPPTALTPPAAAAAQDLIVALTPSQVHLLMPDVDGALRHLTVAPLPAHALLFASWVAPARPAPPAPRLHPTRVRRAACRRTEGGPVPAHGRPPP